MQAAFHGDDGNGRAARRPGAFWVWVSLASALGLGVLTGCVTKAKADAQAREAFLAGQQHATQMLQARGPNIRVIGQVRNTLLPWTIDLTLARAVVAADYYGPADPTDIAIIRDGEIIKVDPERLLSGEDVLLLPRDIIELK